MKKRLRIWIGAAAAFALFAGFASTAQALPSYTSSCGATTCHGTSTSVHVTATQLSNNGTTASYRVAVTGTGGTLGWGVLEGAANRGNGVNSGGTLNLTVGHTYAVWGVQYGLGANHISVTPSAPSTTPPPPPPSGIMTSTLTCKRSASVIYFGHAVTLSGKLSPPASGLKIGIYYRKPRTTTWLRLTTAYTNSLGNWSRRQVLKIRGTWYFRARFLGDATRTAAQSPYYKVQVR